MRAVATIDLKCVKLLLKAGADVNSANKNGDTALIVAASCGSIECTKLLIDAGADVNISNSQEETALIRAAISNNMECVKLLIRAGADVNLGGCTALITAASSGRTALVRILLQAGAKVQKITDKNRNALASSVPQESGFCEDLIAMLMNVKRSR